jgi:N-acyl-D-aspartate/D-glutamate deacylase
MQLGVVLVGALLAADRFDPADVEQAVQADFVIKGAQLHDGSGKPAVKGDLAIKGDRIVGVGNFAVAGKPQVLDGTGLIVAPGFIDLHTHSDYPLQRPKTNANLNYLLQGVTTVVTGNCGSGPADVADYFKKLETVGIGSNVIHQVPHNDVRQAVMKNANRAPTADELKKMEDLVEKGMKDGAWGLATGLIYTPGVYARTDELIALAKVSAKHGGHYASHIRDEGAGVLDATAEAIRIGKEAGLPVHISHMKVSSRRSWGKQADQIALIEQARKAGQVVTADQYPYVASSTGLSAIIVPARFREGDAKDFQERLKDPDTGAAIRKAIETALEGRLGGEALQISSYSPKPAWQGKNLASIAKQENKSATEIALEILRNGGAQIVSFGMSEENVQLVMKQPWVATASDGAARVPSDTEQPHPRSYGTFSRKIGRYAIEDGLISVEQAIRSASGLPADILRLPERGYLKVGSLADVVVLDPKTYRDLATYEKPHQYTPGVRWLFVNGKLTVDEGKYTNALAGRVLRHKSP